MIFFFPFELKPGKKESSYRVVKKVRLKKVFMTVWCEGAWIIAIGNEKSFHVYIIFCEKRRRKAGKKNDDDSVHFPFAHKVLSWFLSHDNKVFQKSDGSLMLCQITLVCK